MVSCISEGESQEICDMACGRGTVTIAVRHTTLKLNDLEQQSFAHNTIGKHLGLGTLEWFFPWSCGGLLHNHRHLVARLGLT